MGAQCAHRPDLLAILCTGRAVLASGALAVAAERRLLQAGCGGGGIGTGRRPLRGGRRREIGRHDRVQQCVLHCQV